MRMHDWEKWRAMGYLESLLQETKSRMEREGGSAGEADGSEERAPLEILPWEDELVDFFKGWWLTAGLLFGPTKKAFALLPRQSSRNGFKFFWLTVGGFYLVFCQIIFQIFVLTGGKAYRYVPAPLARAVNEFGGSSAWDCCSPSAAWPEKIPCHWRAAFDFAPIPRSAFFGWFCPPSDL